MPSRSRVVTAAGGLLLMCIGPAQAQRTPTIPPLPSFQIKLPPAGRYILPALDGEELSSATNTGAALAAIERRTDSTLMASASCQALPAGGYLWRVGIRSPQARGIGVHFADFSVGDGKVWLHDGSHDNLQVVGPYSGRGPSTDGDFETAVVFAPEVVVEYENHRAQVCPEAPPFQIPAITHVWSAAGSTAPGPRDAGSFQCVANSGVPPMNRSEGFTELAGDVVLNCSGGTPTLAGALVPQTDITLFFNTAVTSRLLTSFAEPMLLIDEPTPAQQIVCVPGIPNPAATTNPSFCPMVGTGGNPNEFKSGNANVIMGSVSGNAVTFTGVPVDPPGTGFRVYRITNVRVNATSIAPGPAVNPGPVSALISAFDSNLLPISNSQPMVAFVQPSLATEQRIADDSAPLAAPLTFSQCAPITAQRFMTVRFTEAFQTAFKARTVAPFAGTEISPPPVPQTTLGMVFNSETGFYNPALPGPAGLSGLADFGTRLKAVFTGVPAGVTLFTSTLAARFTSGVPSIAVGSQARLIASETGPFSPVATTGTLEGIPVGPLPSFNGTVTAVWEVLNTNPLTLENFDFPIWISVNAASAGAPFLNLSYAPAPPSFPPPLAASAQPSIVPVPRFVDTSTALVPLQITNCGPQVTATVSTNIPGPTLIVDGSTFAGTQSMSWAAGSSHTISAVSPSIGPPVRLQFTNWSDGGAPTHVVAPTANTNYVANFVMQFQLTTSSTLLLGAGSIVVSPPSADGFYSSGAAVQLTAIPGPGFQFSGWGGDVGGSSNPLVLIMNSPRNVIALFTPLSPAAPVLLSPANGATGVSLTPSLSWSQASGATSYDIFFGTTNPPTFFNGVNGPLAQNFTGTSYSPGTLRLGVTYFWQIVAKNAGGVTFSPVGSFTIQATAPSGGRGNLLVWRPPTGTWYLNPLFGATTSVQWGLPGDIPLAADFDHDGAADYVVWRPSSANWYVKQSSNPSVPIVRQWGLPGDKPVAGDFDGDGKTDFTVWRPSSGTWFITTSTPGDPIVRQWGLPNDIPLAADFDADGKADFTVWRPSSGTWFVLLSRTGSVTARQWGLPGDIPVPADYDGDGIADFAVWRPSEGNWYIVPSGNPAVPIVRQWGLPGDVPVPRDYDGDGKADLAVWRPANGTWYIVPTGSVGAPPLPIQLPPLQIQWGLPGDIPIGKFDGM